MLQINQAYSPECIMQPCTFSIHWQSFVDILVGHITDETNQINSLCHHDVKSTVADNGFPKLINLISRVLGTDNSKAIDHNCYEIHRGDDGVCETTSSMW